MALSKQELIQRIKKDFNKTDKQTNNKTTETVNTNKSEAEASRATQTQSSSANTSKVLTKPELVQRIKNDFGIANKEPSVSENPVKKSAGEAIRDSAGYYGEKLGRGVIDGLEGITDFAWSLVGATGWGITSGFGLFENDVSRGINKWYNDINENDITDLFGSAEERYDAAPDWVKDTGWLPETVGNIVPFVAETIYTGGTSAADDLVVAGKSLWDAGKKLLTNPDVHFGMSAGGNAIETAIDKGANPITATTYGTAAGALEVATEKLFSSGYAGLGDDFGKAASSATKATTSTNKTLLKKIWDSPVAKKAIDITTEGIEEGIVTGVDPILQRVTGVDANAEWANWGDYVESGTHGVILSVVMNAVRLPIGKYGKSKAISSLNESTEVLNGLIQDDTLKLQPLPNNATEEQIVARQKEVSAVALAFDNAVKKAVQNEKQATTEQATAPTTLEEAAKGAVANRTRTASYETLEALSQSNEPITAEEVKRVTRFGEEGAKLVAELANRDGATLSQAERTVKNAYDAGFTDLKATQVNFENDLQKAAFDAGKVDRGVQDRLDLAKAQRATVYKGSFTENEYTKNFTKAERTMISTVAKSLKMDISVVDKIIANEATKAEANAEHRDGKMRISSTADASKVLYQLVMHEGGHRMKQLAPTEFGVLMNALYERDANRYSQAGIFIDDIKTQHDSAGITLDAGGYFEEFAVRKLETIFNSAEEFNKWYAEISGNAQVKTAWQKFMDFISELIEDVKRFVAQSKMTKEERAEAKKSIAELEHIKELYASAFKAAENAATERAKTNSAKNLEIKTNEQYNGSVSHSLKDKYWRTDLNKTQFKELEESLRRIDNHEPKRIADTVGCWYKGRIDGEALFAIYSTETPENPTILYERKGDGGSFELDILLNLMEVIENGESVDGKSAYVNWVSGGGWLQKVNNSQNNLGNLGSGRHNQNVGVLPGQSQRNGSRAFWNVVENLFRESEERSYSLKGSDDTAFKAAQAKQNAGTQKTTDTEGGVQFDLSDGSKQSDVKNRYYSQLDRWDGETIGFSFVLGTTPKALVDAGIPYKQIRLDASKVKSLLGKHNGMIIDTFKQIPNLLENPIVVIDSKQNANSRIVLGDLYDDNGKVVPVVVLLTPTSKKGNQLDIIKVSSAQGRGHIQSLFRYEDGRSVKVRYVDKKRIQSWLNVNRLQLPLHSFNLDSNDIVSQPSKSVNRNFSLKDTEYLELAKDPEKNEAKLREMVEEAAKSNGYTIDGYHGGFHFFTVFGKGNKTSSAPEGAYFFSDNKDVAYSYTAYKKNVDLNVANHPVYNQATPEGGVAANRVAQGGVYSVYLKMENPYVVDFEGKSWGNKVNGLDINETAAWAKENGYDGVIAKNIIDAGDLGDVDYGQGLTRKPSTDYIIFDSSRAKSKDLVTYDNEGNIIPLSERFNEQNEDIRYSLKDSDGNTLTEAQTEFFKESKVMDENGNLLVMYQGATEDFTVFDRKKSSYANLYGRGFYFTKSENHARQYGKTRAFYLNIKHPVSTTETTITKSQLRKFLEAVAENEDYSFENYGYGATVDSVLQSTYGKSDFLMLNDVSQTAIGDLVEAVELFNEVNGTDYDGIMLDTETVIFNSEQAKLTSNENPTSNPDTRFSLKETNGISAKDQKELLDIIEHLKGEFEVTKFAKADPKKLAKMTRDILKEYDSKADHDTTYKAIDKLYQYMANGEDGHPPVWDDVYSRAYKVAQEIVKNALVVDDYSYKEYKSLRDYLRSTPMKFFADFDSVPSAYENFNEFRKLNMGRLKFTNDGTPIDSVYKELSELYPEFFNENEQSNTADQLERIVEVLDSIRATEVNPFDGQIERVSMYLANDLTSRFFDIPQAKPTFADKAERRVTEAKIKGGKKVDAVRQQKDEKIKKLIEAQREKTKRQLDKLREQRDKKVKKEQAKRRDAISKMSESQKAKVLRAKIMRHASDLSKKLVNPTDNQHIPHELRGVVATLLDCINLESNYTYDVESHSYKKNDEGLPTRRTQAFNELRDIYKNIASSVVVDPDLVADGGLLSDVISLADKRIADMNSTELDTIWQTIRAIEASVSTANKVFSQGKFETILGFAEALRDDNAGKKEKTEYKGVLGKGKKLASLDMLTPETYFHYLGGAGDSIFRMMRDAQDKHITIMKEVADFRRKTLKNLDVNSLEKTFHTVKLGGNNVKLTTAQLMELYVLMKRGQAVEHIMVGGILPDMTEGKGAKLNTKAEPIRNLSSDGISAALSKLTGEQKKIADALQKFVSTVLSEYGNEASMKVYNYEKFLEKNYWPIRTNKQEISSDVGNDTAVTSVANKGMAKGTKPHASTSVRIGSIFDTFADHSSDMATYAAWLGTSEDVNRIRNFVFWEDGARRGTVKGILDTVHGIHGSEYLQKLLTDVAIGVKGTDNMNPFDKFIGGYKAASVGANLRVIIQQPTAILRALDMIDARYLAEGMVRPLKGWEKAKKYAPIAQWKDWGHFDINTGRQMKDILFDNASNLEKAKQISMWGASMADSLAWGQLWNAVEAETKANNKTLEEGTEAYYETVAKRFTEIVDHTQVVDGILQRSQIMRSPDALTKMATSFMGEPTKQYNMAISAAYDAKHGSGDVRKKAVKRLGRTAMSLAVSGLINACAQSIIDAMRDDDKEKDYWEKWLAAFVGDGEDNKFINSNVADTVNPLNYVPFAKDVVSIVAGYDVKRMDTETIAKTFSAVTNMYKAVSGTGKYTVAEASAQLFAEIARFYGLPVSNVKRDVKSLVMSVAIETENYLMQYRMEKAMLNINYAGNSKNFMDILFNAYNNDKAAYEIIYKDLLQSGYDAEKIENGMETRMKKAEGVSKASDLSKRYMAPADEKKYDGALSKVKASDVWKSASPAQRKNAEADLFKFITSTDDGTKKKRAEAAEYGVDETEYTLWQLAIEMADQPKGEKGNGSYDYTEKAEAINSLNLGDEEIAYFFGLGLGESATEELNDALSAGIDMQEYVNFKAATSEMKADKNANGNSIPNSKKRKVVNYLDNANLTDEEWEYFYYEVMNYKK